MFNKQPANWFITGSDCQHKNRLSVPADTADIRTMFINRATIVSFDFHTASITGEYPRSFETAFISAPNCNNVFIISKRLCRAAIHSIGVPAASRLLISIPPSINSVNSFWSSAAIWNAKLSGLNGIPAFSNDCRAACCFSCSRYSVNRSFKTGSSCSTE